MPSQVGVDTAQHAQRASWERRPIALLAGRQEALREQTRREEAPVRELRPERPLTRERDFGIELGR